MPCTAAEIGNEERPQWSGGVRGRCRARTDDLFRVKEARYQLRQSPIVMWSELVSTADSILADAGRRMHIGAHAVAGDRVMTRPANGTELSP